MVKRQQEMGKFIMTADSRTRKQKRTRVRTYQPAMAERKIGVDITLFTRTNDSRLRE